MRLLVLGGTRFLSRAVTEDALARGHEVWVACRGTAPVPQGAVHVPLDRFGPDAAGVLTGLSDLDLDVVLEVARTPSWVRTAVTALPRPHWVFVSTISVYAERGQVLPPREEDVDLSVDVEAYGPMKVACEDLVRAGAASATVVRPGLIVGPGDPSGRFTAWPVRIAEAGAGPVLAPGGQDDPVQVIDVRDLAAWCVDLGQARQVGTFDAIGPAMPMGRLLTEVAAGVGENPELVWVESARLLELGVRPWMGPGSVPLWIPPEEEGGLSSLDAGPAMQAGLAVRPVRDTARDTLTWVAEERRAGRAPRADGLSRAEELGVLDRA